MGLRGMREWLVQRVAIVVVCIVICVVKRRKRTRNLIGIGIHEVSVNFANEDEES
jgi:hypothetical protein